MSEKRFSYGRKNDLNFGYCPHCIRDLQEDKIFTDYTEIVDLLNKQSDEIGNLKSENEQLKSKASSWKITCSQVMNEKADLMKQLVSLKEENEQLRHELDSLTGCYCADNKEFKDYWRIGYDD